MKLIAHIPSHIELRTLTDFLRGLGLELKYKNGCLIAQGRADLSKLPLGSQYSNRPRLPQ